jgi:hypothetical protein
MPFTISHAAAVLPFTRPLARWRLLSATVIGSMVPDFGFLMPWRPPRVETHSAMALLTFCLPVGLLTFWIFQKLVKAALLEVLPNATYSRWRPSAQAADPANPVAWLVAAFGILAGAVTHLIWDAFTHEGARGVRMIPALDDPYVEIAGHHLVGPRLLQDMSSLVGLVIVLLIIGFGLRAGHPGADNPPRRLRRTERYSWVAAYVVIAFMFGALSILRRRPLDGSVHPLGALLGSYAIAALRGLVASVLVVSVALLLRLRASAGIHAQPGDSSGEPKV